MNGKIGALPRILTFNDIYPVGSIYITLNTANPKNLFGGEWSKIEGRFLLGTNSSHSAESKGGSERHFLTQDELPVVQGAINSGSGNAGASANGYGTFRSANGCFSALGERQYSPSENKGTWPNKTISYEKVEMSFGGGQPHNNMPPYYAVHMWRRTA